MPLIDDASLTLNKELREKLLECYLAFSTSKELSAWLEELGQDPKGTVEEKTARVRQHTRYLSMPPESFPAQTIEYLNNYNAEALSEICRNLSLNEDGPRNALFRRIYREVGFREGWLRPIPKTPEINKEIVLPFVNWYPILKNGNYEKDYYRVFYNEMSEIFGEVNVHQQLPVNHGGTLKIDFHIGHPQEGGMGVEFKMPTNNSELQRALGQMDQYVRRYGPNLIVVLIPDFLEKAQEILFSDELKRKGIEVVVKTRAS